MSRLVTVSRTPSALWEVLARSTFSTRTLVESLFAIVHVQSEDENLEFYECHSHTVTPDRPTASASLHRLLFEEVFAGEGQTVSPRNGTVHRYKSCYK